MNEKIIAELKAWANDRVDELHMHPKAVIEFYEILSRAEAVEPLAITASKFGMSVYSRKRIKGFVPELAWGISLNRRGGVSAFISYASTYAAAEAKAREWLEKLSDKEEGK